MGDFILKIIRGQIKLIPIRKARGKPIETTPKKINVTRKINLGKPLDFGKKVDFGKSLDLGV